MSTTPRPSRGAWPWAALKSSRSLLDKISAAQQPSQTSPLRCGSSTAGGRPRCSGGGTNLAEVLVGRQHHPNTNSAAPQKKS